MLSTKGIIFRTVRYSESSLIVEVFTQEKGLVSFFMNGAFKKASLRLPSILQLANQIELVAYYNESKNLHRIKEVSVSKIYTRINQDIHYSAISTFILEISRQCIRDSSAHPELYFFLENSLTKLDDAQTLDSNYHIHFLVQFSHYFGFFPFSNYSNSRNSFDLVNGLFIPYDEKNKYSVLPEHSILINQLIGGERIQIDLTQRRIIMQILLQYYQIHIDQFKMQNSPQIFRSIL